MGASLTLPSPLSSDWERPGRGMAAPSPSSSVSYSARHPPPHLCSDAGIREVGRVPGTLVLGGAGAGGWLSQGRVLGCVGRGVCARVKWGGRFPSSSSSWEEEKS